jgi:hypothetical protein
MKSAHKSYKRTWLNPKGAAYVIADVTATQADPEEGENRGWIDCGLDIGDCSRKVSLDFYAYNKADVLRIRRKWGTLIKSILKAREEWEAAADKVFGDGGS